MLEAGFSPFPHYAHGIVRSNASISFADDEDQFIAGRWRSWKFLACLIEQPRSPGEICEQLQLEFDVSAETCRAEVDDFLGELARQGAVVLEPPPTA